MRLLAGALVRQHQAASHPHACTQSLMHRLMHACTQSLMRRHMLARNFSRTTSCLHACNHMLSRTNHICTLVYKGLDEVMAPMITAKLTPTACAPVSLGYCGNDPVHAPVHVSQLARRLAARAIKLAFGSQGMGREAEQVVPANSR